MKWKYKQIKPRFGEARIVKRFCWLPRKTTSSYVHWLEYVECVEKYYGSDLGGWSVEYYRTIG